MDTEGLPIWARPQRVARVTSSSLSLQQIVQAAIKVADAESLGAVSMRRVATELQAGAMSLYRYVSTKDDLLDLMLDEVMGEVVADTPEGVSIASGDLRHDLQRLGHGLREQIHRHPWLPQLLSGRPAFGPNMVRCFETAMSVFDGMNVDADSTMNAIGALNAFVYGFAQQELAEQEMQRQTGLSENEWRQRMAPYIGRLMETGKYPRLRKVLVEGTDSDDHSIEFAAQLQIVIDGILASLSAKKRARATK